VEEKAMRETKLCSWIVILTAIALLAAIGATPALAAKPAAPTPAACPTTINQLKTQGSTVVNADFVCNPTVARVGVWHFVVNQTTSCPGSIDVVFETCGAKNIPLSAEPGGSGTCFYDLADCVGDTLTAASQPNGGQCTTNSQYVLSSAPCLIETLAVADFNNDTGTLGCDPTANLTDPVGAGACLPLADETNCGITPVATTDLPDANVDIATTNAPQGTTIKFHVFSASGVQPIGQCVDICSPGNEVHPSGFEPDTGGFGTVVQNSPNFALSPVWTILNIDDGNNLKAFTACILDSNGTELLCSGCEEWPITPTPGGEGEGCRTIGFWMTHGEGLCHRGNNADAWPALSTQLHSLCSPDDSTCEAQLCTALHTPPKGDQCVQMKRQLIGALLNIAAGNTADAGTTTAINTAIGLLTDATPDSAQQAACAALIAPLTNFNESNNNTCNPTVLAE
jgi:hypothetical protein